MKIKYNLLILAFAALGLYGCGKDQLVNIGSYGGMTSPTVVGKWYENKLVIQHRNRTTGTITDTAFAGLTFDATDNFQFGADSSAAYFQGANLNALGIGQSSNGMGVINLDPKNLTFTMKSLGMRVALKNPVTLPANVPPYTNFFIEELGVTNLVLSSVDSTSNPGYTNTFYIYYTKGN